MKYRCGNCGKVIDSKDLEILPGIRCSYCGYRVLYKLRTARIRKIKAV